MEGGKLRLRPKSMAMPVPQMRKSAANSPCGVVTTARSPSARAFVHGAPV